MRDKAKSRDLIDISVVVITYNSSETIIETLDSVYNQTYDRIELVVSDDSSGDDTVDIVKKWMNEKQHRFINCILLISEKNEGVVFNCNRAVRSITTDYYRLLAGDDIMYENAIEQYVIHALNSESNVVWVADVDIIGDDEVENAKQKESIKYAIRWLYLDRSQQRKMFYENHMVVTTGVGVIRRKTYEDAHGYDERFPAIEDYPFFLKLFESGYEFKHLPQTLSAYRVVENSACRKPSVKFRKSLKDFFWKERFWKMLKQKSYIACINQMKGYILMDMEKRNDCY